MGWGVGIGEVGTLETNDSWQTELGVIASHSGMHGWTEGESFNFSLQQMHCFASIWEATIIARILFLVDSCYAWLLSFVQNLPISGKKAFHIFILLAAVLFTPGKKLYNQLRPLPIEGLFMRCHLQWQKGFLSGPSFLGSNATGDEGGGVGLLLWPWTSRTLPAFCANVQILIY